MIEIERWLDVLSIAVIVGIVGVLLNSMRQRRVSTRSLSEKPALFLEFTGKQVSVRRKKSKILPSEREQAEARNMSVGSTLAGFKGACLATRRDSLRIWRETLQRSSSLMTATARQTSVTAARVVVALRASLEVANRVRVGSLLKRGLSGVQERLTWTPQRFAWARIARLGGLRRELRIGHSCEQAVKRLRQGATDVLLYVDYRWYRLERSLQSQRQQFAAVTSRLAKTPFKELHVVRVLMMNTQNGFAAQERVQNRLREANSVILQRWQDLAAGCRALQDAARGYIRRLSETENPEPAEPESVKSPGASSSGFGELSAAEPVVLSLTSAGTLKLKSRLEDERTSMAPRSAGSMSAASKGAPALGQVSVRYVGALQRRYGDPGESRQSKQAIK